MTDNSQRKIVVVEDDPATRKLLQHQLQNAGYEVSACADGRSALQSISAIGSGIVLADWSMPEMDGLELCRAVRELEEMQTVGHIYFILLTAHDSKDQIVAGLDAGANDYLTKPYHPGELLARIHVGERMLRLQAELLERNLEFHKANMQLALLTRRLDELAHTDGLTGLTNRRHLFERLEELWALSERRDLPLSCVMLDIDRFKQINDTYGHQAGDEVLRDVATVIQQSARRPDVCGRFGGEEFVVLCPATDAEGAAHLAERIRANVATRTIVRAGESLAVTLSCGVAERQDCAERPADLIQKADQVLYAAKEHGRNQSWIHDGSLEGRRVAIALPVT